MDSNFKTLLSEMPQGQTYPIATNGIIIKQDTESMPTAQRIPKTQGSCANKRASTPINSNNGCYFHKGSSNSVQALIVQFGGSSSQKLYYNGSQQRLTSPSLTLYTNLGHTQTMLYYPQSQQRKNFRIRKNTLITKPFNE